VAILLQPVDWHHPDVARAIHGHLGPSPCHPSAGFLCRSTSDGALGTFPATAGLLPLPGPPAPPVWGPWTNGWDTQSLTNSLSTMTLAPPTLVSNWVADSGASYHTIPDAGILSSTSPSHPSLLSSIVVGNDSALPVTSICDAVLPGPFVYPTLLLLPTLFKIFFLSVSLLLTTLIPWSLTRLVFL
jgi:hypothetical protein